MSEKVHVWARSKHGKIEPLQFIFKNKRYSIHRVSRSRRQIQKKEIYYSFAVDLLPAGTCELQFSLRSGQWHIKNSDQLKAQTAQALNGV